jgi:hypothetical protein
MARTIALRATFLDADADGRPKVQRESRDSASKPSLHCPTN